MSDLVPSGRFAQLARLSRKALHLYAELGLLRAVYTNAENGYHYYSLSQLEEAWRISRLRELGMPLEAIRETLRSWNSPDLKTHLEQHRQHLLQQAAQVQSALEAVNVMLKAPKQAYPVLTRTVGPQVYLGLRAWCPPDDACAFIGATQKRLYAFLERAAVQPAGACFARYHDETEDAWDVEVCVPITEKPRLELPEGMALNELPAATVAFTLHAGDCGGNHGLQAAYTAVWRWLHEHGHDTLGGPLEVYLFDETNTADVADHRTEVGWMIRPA